MDVIITLLKYAFFIFVGIPCGIFVLFYFYFYLTDSSFREAAINANTTEEERERMKTQEDNIKRVKAENAKKWKKLKDSFFKG